MWNRPNAAVFDLDSQKAKLVLAKVCITHPPIHSPTCPNTQTNRWLSATRSLLPYPSQSLQNHPPTHLPTHLPTPTHQPTHPPTHLLNQKQVAELAADSDAIAPTMSLSICQEMPRLENTGRSFGRGGGGGGGTSHLPTHPPTYPPTLATYPSTHCLFLYIVKQTTHPPTHPPTSYRRSWRLPG